MPFLPAGSFAVAKLCGADQLRCGDIAVFRKEDLFICHRVVKIFKCNAQVVLRIKPDIYYALDPLVNNSAIVGKIISVQYGKFSVNIDSFLARVFGYFIGYSVPFLAWLYFKIKKLSYAFNNRDSFRRDSI